MTRDSRPITLVGAIDRLEQTHIGFSFLATDGAETFVSFADLKDQVRRRAGALRAAGVQPGDRVGLVLPDPRDFVLTFLGVIYAGAVPVPMYPPLALGKLETYLNTAAAILRAAGARWVIASKQVTSVLWPVAPHVATLVDILTVEKLQGGAPIAGVSPDFSDVVFLQFTSGSTSDPKGVRVTHGSLFANTLAIMNAIDSNSEHDRAVSWLPLYHDMGLIGFVISPLVFGVHTTLIPTLSFIKRPTLWLDVLSQKKATLTFAPNFAYALLDKRVSDARKWDLSSLKVAGCGAEPIQPEVMTRFVSKFSAAGLRPGVLMPAYGMAEATLAMAFNPLGAPFKVDVVDREVYRRDKRATPIDAGEGAHFVSRESAHFVSCGQAMEGHAISIVDDHGRHLPERHVGEIVFSGPSVADGYDGRADATRAAFKDEWLHTGDLGYIADGELYICGRKKDLIIINGRNYNPQAIEWQAESVAGVRKGAAIAFSVPGEASEALVVALESASAGQKEAADKIAHDVRQIITEQLSLTPREVVVLHPGTLPKTSSGKLQRQKARAQFLDGTLGKEGVRTMGARAERIVLARALLRAWQSKMKHRLAARMPWRGALTWFKTTRDS